jgi:hypothetical protein
MIYAVIFTYDRPGRVAVVMMPVVPSSYNLEDSHGC